jgi:hypothetical protein
MTTQAQTMKLTQFIKAALLLLTFSATSLASTYDEAQTDWENVLHTFVNEEGQTDFITLRNNRSSLDRYVAFIAETSPDTRPELFPDQEAILAFYINSYNALAMHGVIEKNITTGFNSFFKRAGFFKFHKIIVGGETTSLYDLENDVVRPLGDPRVHFALNCMVKDCPRLPQKAFTAANLDIELDALTREFFSKDRHLRLDHEKKTLWVSEILKFYTRDFVASGKKQDLLSYINKYVDKKIPENYKIRFIPYDWTLNQQALSPN